MLLYLKSQGGLRPTNDIEYSLLHHFEEGLVIVGSGRMAGSECKAATGLDEEQAIPFQLPQRSTASDTTCCWMVA